MNLYASPGGAHPGAALPGDILSHTMPGWFAKPGFPGRLEHTFRNRSRNGAPLLGEEWGSTFGSGMGLHFWVRNGAPLLGQEWGSTFGSGMGFQFLYGNSR